MNILLTCAGRRSYIVEYFRKALNGQGKIHVANSHKYTTAMEKADVQYLSPSIFEIDYADKILEYCIKNKIELVISLFDLELPILAKSKKRFTDNGIFLAISNYSVCELCNDKWATYLFLKDNGFNVVPSFLTIEGVKEGLSIKESKFPYYIKPRWGMGSIGIMVAEEENDITCMINFVKRKIQQSYISGYTKVNEESVIIQEVLPGQEYGLDIINDFAGNYITTFVKKKLAMRSGETDIAITVNEPQLEIIGERISSLLKHVGIMDCDVFWDGSKAYVLEMNARFGGGYPFSHLAGADIPMFYLKQAGFNAPSDSLSIEIGVTGYKEITPSKSKL